MPAVWRGALILQQPRRCDRHRYSKPVGIRPQPGRCAAIAATVVGCSGERRYWVGTSGWQYDHWRGRFYPEDLEKKQWFQYYADHFRCVEVNNSFYRQPSASAWDAWHDQAPGGFRYAIKANRYITHMKRFKDPQGPLERFLGGAERLKSFLGPVLFQTHPQFENNPRNQERLDGFLQLLPGRIKSVFEFRHDSWFDDSGLKLLRRHGAGFCVEDMPGLKCPTVATAEHAYFRFHGIEKAYEGKYSDNALAGWADTIRRLDGVNEVWVFFNNDQNAYAAENARTMAGLLEG